MFYKKKWIEINDLSRVQYSVNKNIGFKTLIYVIIVMQILLQKEQ